MMYEIAIFIWWMVAALVGLGVLVFLAIYLTGFLYYFVRSTIQQAKDEVERKSGADEEKVNEQTAGHPAIPGDGERRAG